MQCTALIMQVEGAVMVVGVRGDERTRHVNVSVPGNGATLEHIERVVVEQGNDACDLSDDEQRQQAGAKAMHRAKKRHVQKRIMASGARVAPFYWHPRHHVWLPRHSPWLYRHCGPITPL